MDASDLQVFDQAAEPGEWAVSGAFVFADSVEDQLTGKSRQAFANGFLGTASFGWSTFVSISEMTETEFNTVVDSLAAHFVADYGAPDIETAMPAARAEADFSVSLCEYPVNTLLCVTRNFDEGGIREQFRSVEPWRDSLHAPVWTIESDDDTA